LRWHGWEITRPDENLITTPRFVATSSDNRRTPCFAANLIDAPGYRGHIGCGCRHRPPESSSLIEKMKDIDVSIGG
jgi:hypothetical protein